MAKQQETPQDAKRPLDRLVMRRTKCCKCGWEGKEAEKERVASPFLKKLGVKGWDRVCPKCWHHDFYQL